MLKWLKNSLPDQHPLRLFYHKTLAVLANLRYFFPSNKIFVIGVTGTKGKTTTTNLIARVLEEAGFRVGLTSTTNFQIGEKKWTNKSKMTTLNPFFLQKMLSEMVARRCQFAVIEVSSHALVQNRVWGVNFDIGVLTNVGEDHLDYHGGFSQYLRAKGLLFSRLNKSARKPKMSKISIVNFDDENFAYFDQFMADKKYNFGVKGGTCHATDIVLSENGSSFVLHIPNNQTEVKINMPGQFSVYNAVAAATVGVALGFKLEPIKKALESSKTIPGRFEKVDAGQDFNVIVDYAHTEESLEKLLELYKSSTKGKLYAVFGATGGGRDKSKRPKMGAAADKNADIIILTDDDPYSEDSVKIIEDIAAGINRKEGENFWKIPTRREAIRFALMNAKKDDTVVIAGKGAETIQMIAGQKIDWNDRKVVEEILSRPLQVEL